MTITITAQKSRRVLATIDAPCSRDALELWAEVQFYQHKVEVNHIVETSGDSWGPQTFHVWWKDGKLLIGEIVYQDMFEDEVERMFETGKCKKEYDI